MKIPQTPPAAGALLEEVLADGRADEFHRIVEQGRPTDAKGRYLHWDEMRRRKPPDGLTHEDWWLSTWLSRRALWRLMPLTGVDGTRFGICMVDAVWESLRRIDQAAAGDVLADEPSVAAGNRDRYIVSSLIEEAIASSQLEGASSTRSEAKRMLLTDRPPRDRSEQMILNNYRAISRVRDLARDELPLTTETICELHRVLVVDAIDDPADAGRIQREDETRVWVSWPDGSHDEQRLHTPPRASELPGRMEAMCAFANGESDNGFVHPVVRAIALHFWLAYDHPFVDGNGRLARSLFYWSMLRSKYWLAEFLTVSSILRLAPAKYARSFLYTETDSNDLTHFVLYQLDVIERAIKELRTYLQAKREEVREVEEMLAGRAEVNHRQRSVLATALRDANADFLIAGHQRKQSVTYQTARTDLLGLAELGLLAMRRDGKSYRFLPVPDLVDRIRGLGKSED